MRTFGVSVFVSVAAISAAQYDMSMTFTSQSQPVAALQRPDVRKELHLTRDQNSQIDKVEKDFGSMARGKRGQEMNFSMDQMDEENKQILDVLDPAQTQRLFEIRVQMMGPSGILDPEVAGKLSMTKDELDKGHQLQDAYFGSVMALMQDQAKHPMSSNRGKVIKLRDQHDAEMLALLTDDQRTKLQAFQGTPFKNARSKDGF